VPKAYVLNILGVIKPAGLSNEEINSEGVATSTWMGMAL